MTAPRLVIPDLAGKIVLITGGSTGIGAAVARGFSGQGAMVAIGYHASKETALALASEIEAAGGEALAVEGDVARPVDCRADNLRDNGAIRPPRRPDQQRRSYAWPSPLHRGE